MQLIFDYPWYFVLFCLLAGAAYAAALYWRKPLGDTPRWLRLALPALRFVTVSLICFLLLAPLVRRSVQDPQRPLIVVAQDVSESVTETLPQLTLSSQLSALGSYEVVTDSFGGKSTDIAAALSDIADRYAGRNLGAIVLASDGIYNQGANPVTVAGRLAVPVYTVALGDTTHHRDAAIAHLRYNHTAYLGNQFPVEVTLHADRLQGHHATLTISRGGQRLASREVHYDGTSTTLTETFTLTADKAGLAGYTVSLTPCDGEHSTVNNSRSFAVEVIDGHQRIGILAAAPHPDISALRQAIEQNPNYEVELLDPGQPSALNARLSALNLLILHNLPSQVSTLKFQLSSFNSLPTIIIVGRATDLGRFNALHSGYDIIAKSRQYDAVTAVANRSFTLFTCDDAMLHTLEQMPPLDAPFGDYRESLGGQTLLHARIGSVASQRPLIAFSQQQGIRHAFIFGEGLWRWRLQCYQMNGNHDAFDQLIQKMVTYTSLQAARQRFLVTGQPIYREDEAVTLEAELYNDSYEPVNQPDVQVTISSSVPEPDEGQPSAHTYDFNRRGDGYFLNLGTLAPGHYSYHASTLLSGHRYEASGHFIVEETRLEAANLVADHTLLTTLSSTTGGEMLRPDDLGRLPQLLADRDDIRTVIYSHTRYTDLLNLPLIFLLLVLLLACEWAVRKLYLT